MTDPPPPPASRSDEDLAAQARGGDRSAFARLVERHGGGVLAVLERRVGELQEAQDLSQEVWIKVFRGLAGFDARRAFRPWLYSIVLNHLRDRLRRRERRLALRSSGEDERELALLPAPRGDDPRRFDERSAIETSLARVPEPFRTALLLVDVLELTYAEAARAEGCAEGTLKSRVSRGRRAFREAYRAASGEEAAREVELPPATPSTIALVMP